ncbi:hypothetical protein KZE55_04190 [Limosilactobacillus panis]|uniref:hypothetical protein n=1 Tax=Limosilactobacillus panis TaxID=47493 RepID=UPI001C9429A2|nr:hypothetical protein [Limosilactobacillus panis]QZN93734.1 hypothetical protein KZE55_04190 [Limosilactobacillus panis]
MKIIIICIIAVVVVACLYTVVHRILINRATIMLRRRAQETTDAAVNASLQKLLGWDRFLNSQLVADVWGKGVLAFEYHFDGNEKRDTKLTPQNLNEQLGKYANAHQLTAVNKSFSVFRVTDWWQYEGVLHIDVAYILNEATAEYVADLKKLKQHSK